MKAFTERRRTAIVTGGNRGLGMEICRQLAGQGTRVILTARDAQRGHAAVDSLREGGVEVSFCPLDITVPGSIDSLIDRLYGEVDGVDILVNNAGIYLDQGVPGLETTPDLITRAVATDVCGAFALCRAVIPRMRERGYGRIVNLSSRTSQPDQMDNKGLSYKIAKAGLNVVTVVLSKELEEDNILINAVNPGWVSTEMGGQQAPLSIEDGAKGPVYLATLPDGGPSGCFFNGCDSVPW